MDRRDFITGAALATVVSVGFGEHVLARSRSAVDLEEATIASLQQAMASGATTSKAIVQGEADERFHVAMPRVSRHDLIKVRQEGSYVLSDIDLRIISA